jgi:hypothetical protein
VEGDGKVGWCGRGARRGTAAEGRARPTAMAAFRVSSRERDGESESGMRETGLEPVTAAG